MPKTSVFSKSMNRDVVFQDRHSMKRGHPTARFQLAGAESIISLPIDWTKGGALSFPMWWNNTLGDCMEEGANHVDQSMTGCATGVEANPDPNAMRAQYLKASGGDNGLDEGTLVSIWTNPGLSGNSKATILDHVDVDPNNAAMVATYMNYFGPLIFMLAVPDEWVQTAAPGFLWTSGAGIVADENNGHGVAWTGINSSGSYQVQTWGFNGYITPAGVALCDPSAFGVFSLRWFNAQGVAPNGMTYDQLAALWKQYTGRTLPSNPFTNTPTPPVNPPVQPPVTQGGVLLSVNGSMKAGAYSLGHGNTFTLGGPIGSGSHHIITP